MASHPVSGCSSIPALMLHLVNSRMLRVPPQYFSSIAHKSKPAKRLNSSDKGLVTTSLKGREDGAGNDLARSRGGLTGFGPAHRQVVAPDALLLQRFHIVDLALDKADS